MGSVADAAPLHRANNLTTVGVMSESTFFTFAKPLRNGQQSICAISSHLQTMQSPPFCR
jgi:hypothetical protein